MTIPTWSRRARRAGLATGVLAVALPLAACGGDRTAAGPEPTNISIAPSSAAPTAAATSPAASPTAQAPTPATDPSTARSERIDLRGAVTAAEATVADSAVVEVSREDDGAVAWEVTVRAGENARELHLSDDGTVLENKADSLSSAQRGEPPAIAVLAAVTAAEKRIDGGVVTDAELSNEDGQRIWDISVDGDGGDEWELWIDATSGKVLRQERD